LAAVILGNYGITPTFTMNTALLISGKVIEKKWKVSS